MRRVLSTLFLLAWGIWFGGILFLFLTVTTLFGQSRQLGAAAAPPIFLCFEKYHVILACICILLATLLLPTPPRRARRWIFAVIAVGSVTALISSQFLTPRINALHVAGLVNTPEFRRLHGISFILYLCEAIAMLAVGLILPWAMAGSEHKASP
jgi:hypothetical protein